MKKFIWVLFILMSCGKEPSSSLVSGLPLNDTINQDASVTLNYRINQSAIDAHSSFAFLNQLEKWRENNIPASWGVPDLNIARELFLYLHKKTNSKEILSVATSADQNLVKLQFHSAQNDYLLWTNKDVTIVRWFENGGLEEVKMNQLSKDVWTIEKGDDHFLWNVEDKKICENTCIDL